MSQTENCSFNNICFNEETTDKNELFDGLYKEFSEETDDCKKTNILHSLVETYLLHFKEELQKNVRRDELFELIAQVPVLCSKFLQTGSLNEMESYTLKTKRDNLESACLCFDTLISCVEAFRLTEQCLITIKISLNILSQGYTHCKESEIIYGEFLEQFSDQLGIFFKKIENLQMLVLPQIDLLDVINGPCIDSVVFEMGNFCEIVFSLDADIAFELWAKYIRILGKYPSLEQISNISSLSTYLTLKNIEILELIKCSFDRVSDEDDELAAKFSFYLDALSTLVNLVPDSCKETVLEYKTFLLNFLDFLLICFSPFTPEKNCLEIIKQSVLKNSFTLIENFYANEHILNGILLTPSGTNNILTTLFLKLCALQFMKGSPLELKIDFFKDIFSDCILGTREDDMKLLCIKMPRCVVSNNSIHEFTSLFQFAYEQISEFSKSLPDSAIKDLENTVLTYLESCSDVIYLLISDVWIYRLRCGSIKFMRDRCYCFLQYHSHKAVRNHKIENLINRMLKFLPNSYKESLLEEFSYFKVILDDRSIEHRYGIPDNACTDNEICIHSENQINDMMKKLIEKCPNNPLQLVQKALIYLDLCILFLSGANCSETLQLIEGASELFKTDVYEIQIAVLTFIKALSRKYVPEHTEEFGEIVSLLACLFSEAINSKNYVVKYEARNTFSYFAKCTPHIKIVQETIKRDSSLKPTIKSYMNAVPQNGFLSEKEIVICLKRTMETSAAVKFEISKKSIELLEQFFTKCNLQLLV